MMHRFTRLLAGAAALATATAAPAAVITFDGLTGANGDPFVPGYAEAGFLVYAPFSAGDVFEGHVFGNPEPSLVVGPVFNGTRTARLQILRPGEAPFRLNGFDFTSQGGSGSYTVTAYVGIAQPYSFTGSGDFNAVWQTIAGRDAQINFLTIDVLVDGTSINIDNIDVTAVPEPASWALMVGGFGIAGAALRRRPLSRRA